jgi:predicted RNA-binding Zn-ribbon protein involved in translation (DUF1610 family)
VGSLQTRVKRLEGGGQACPECGFDGEWSKVETVTSWTEDGTADNRYCETCGRPIHIVITWGDAPD